MSKHDLKSMLLQERASLLYDFDKVRPENRERYEYIQRELRNLEREFTEIPESKL